MFSPRPSRDGQPVSGEELRTSNSYKAQRRHRRARYLFAGVIWAVVYPVLLSTVAFYMLVERGEISGVFDLDVWFLLGIALFGNILLTGVMQSVAKYFKELEESDPFVCQGCGGFFDFLYEFEVDGFGVVRICGDCREKARQKV